MIAILALVAVVVCIALARTRQLGDLPTALRSIFTDLRNAWARFASGSNAPWLVAAAVIGLAAVVFQASLLLVLLVGTLAVWFASAWLREFRFLILLSDDVFPGQNDKLIWAILLIVLPPVGLWLFQSYREVHWPETKPTAAGSSELG
jgi:hypothetical protein